MQDRQRRELQVDCLLACLHVVGTFLCKQTHSDLITSTGARAAHQLWLFLRVFILNKCSRCKKFGSGQTSTRQSLARIQSNPSKVQSEVSFFFCGYMVCPDSAKKPVKTPVESVCLHPLDNTPKMWVATGQSKEGTRRGLLNNGLRLSHLSLHRSQRS